MSTRIVLRHLSGSKANQVEEFPLTHFKELSIGRDPSSTVRYDQDKDDLVGRLHARIVQDSSDPNSFTVVDASSRNGTYVNKQRIIGAAKIMPGDVVQFGAGGPEFQFDLEPRPENLVKSTRIGFDPNATVKVGGVPETRVPDSSPKIPSTMPASTPSAVGKATVERMIAQTKSESRKNLFLVVGAIVVIVVVVGGFLMYQNLTSRNKLASDISATKEAMATAAAGAPMTPAAIVKAYTGSVVYIEVAWKLIYTPTGGQLYHEHIPNRIVRDGKEVSIIPNGPQYLAAYIQFPDGSIEPSLTLDGGGGNTSIGGMHTGSGFVVGNDGYILTNRHVAATWYTSYYFSPDEVPGLVFQIGEQGKKFVGILQDPPRGWVPAEAKAVGRKPLQGKVLDGRTDYLDVTFAKNELRIPAKLVRTSDRHDAAMIKIDLPQSVTKVELNDNYDQIQPGEAITILGYPGISPDVAVRTKSQDPFNREGQFKIVPDPTVTGGLIGKVIRGEASVAGGDKSDYVSMFGDSYQLTANATGAGNSGGPVFDDHGRVIGIFYAGSNRPGDAAITFAVPIHFGIELMGTTRVLK